MSRKYKFTEKLGAYFISFATVNWIDTCLSVDRYLLEMPIFGL
ncbi:hypothetical protein M2326_002707 [Flavobacterium sp. 7A]|nr:hypothetical protein [Flavobacterium sp. 7A]